MTDKLNALFSSKEFIETNQNLSTREEIFAAVSAQIPEVTTEALDAYITSITAAGQAGPSGELDEAALEQVAGGDASTVLGIISFAYGAGYAIGLAIKNWRKK